MTWEKELGFRKPAACVKSLLKHMYASHIFMIQACRQTHAHVAYTRKDICYTLVICKLKKKENAAHLLVCANRWYMHVCAYMTRIHIYTHVPSAGIYIMDACTYVYIYIYIYIHAYIHDTCTHTYMHVWICVFF
jgi:hypothetical protein